MSSFSQVARQRPSVERARLLAIYLPEQRKDPEEMHLARPTPLQTSPAPAGQGVLEDKSSSPKVSRSIANEQAVRCRTVLLTERHVPPTLHVLCSYDLKLLRTRFARRPQATPSQTSKPPVGPQASALSSHWSQGHLPITPLTMALSDDQALSHSLRRVVGRTILSIP